MDRRAATEDIKARWRELYPADGNGRGKGIICPLCHSGSGKNGTGISEMPNSRNHFLKCWNGGCDFEKGGSVIDLYMLEHGITDFSKAVDDLAAQLRITIDPYTGPRSSGPAGDQDPSLNGITVPAAAPAAEMAQEMDPPHPDYRKYYKQCAENFQNSEEAQAYITRRGISLDTAIGFKMGYDSKWISPAVIKSQQEKGSEWLPDPKPCLIIPVTREFYITRDIRPDLTDQQKKYAKMNVGTSKILGAGALQSGAENIFVTEGAFDALSVVEVGQAAIALNSTSNTGKLIKLLEEQPTTATLILCLDNDEAGRAATRKLKDGLQRLNISYVDGNICAGYKDPNEALTADRAAFEAAVSRAIASTAARPDNTATYLDNLMAGEIERFKEAQNRLTGFSNLDEKAGGLNAGLYLLAAISSLGKTTFALQMAYQLAASGQEVLFFSLEQSRLEMVSKNLSRLTAQADMRTAVTSLAIRRGFLPSQVLAAVQTYKNQAGERLSIIEGNFNCDAGYIADYIRRYQQRTGTTPTVFVDYLQILSPAAEGKARNSKREEVDIAITELKRLSRELNLTIIAISSINRANYMTPFSFESLKESGGLEFTADVIWGLQLACLDEPLFDKEGNIKEKRARINAAKVEDPRKIKFVCLKNRYGIASFECNFTYDPKYDLFMPAQALASPIGPQKGRKSH